MSDNNEHLDVYQDRSELHSGQGVTIFMEGFQNKDTQRRYERLNSKLGRGYLQSLFDSLSNEDYSELPVNCQTLLKNLVGGVTSEVGRALVGVAFLQLTIKSIVPEQSIRLHKGTTRNGSFSWVDGISMRTLDSNYNTPFLRQNGLLNVNKFGVFMTRSLAENYPYSKLYKAEMRGPFNEWIAIVDALEDNSMPAKAGLCYLMALLKNRSDAFKISSDKAISLAEKYKNKSFNEIHRILEDFYNNTGYSARAFEVVMHGLMQALQECSCLGDYQVVEMSQMRSANKKHGNVGDIELKDGHVIVEAWDAKYGKPYLRDELDELNDKILRSPGVKVAGFVVDKNPDRRKEITDRMEDLTAETDVDILILSFDEWVKWQVGDKTGKELDVIGYHWLMAVVESFAQRRPEIAPIDEPCEQWIDDLIKMLN